MMEITRTDPVTVESPGRHDVPVIWKIKNLRATYTVKERDFHACAKNRLTLIKELLTCNDPSCYQELPSVLILSIAPSRLAARNHQFIKGETTITLDDGPLKGYTFLVDGFSTESLGHQRFIKCNVEAISRTVILDPAI